MPVYRYRAISNSGETQQGDAETHDAAAARQQLRQRGLMLLDLREASATPSLFAGFDTSRRRVNSRELADFASGLAALLAAGLPLDRALAAMGREDKRSPLAGVAAKLREAVRRGQPLAQAMEAHGALFSPMQRALVQAGETGGNLAACLQRMAEMAERRVATVEALRSALVYPACLLVMALLSLVFIATVVLPQFHPFFEDAGVAMPLPAEILLGSGDLLRDYYYLLLPLLAALVWTAFRAARHPELRLKRDRLLLRLPVVGPLLAVLEAERLCRLLATLLHQGVALPAAWRLTLEGLGNAAFSASLELVAGLIRRGGDLAGGLANSPYLPATAIDLVAIGEQSGQLAAMLLRAADLIDLDAKRRTQRLLALLSPIVTVLVGALVAAVIATVFTALLSLNQLAT
ncbi:type II secretion system F family protein [Ferrovibrio sp.]|uniref:type II secretion system F family protein n=1 Tax=Ferrovibrio sp. TaxID=1917215 RepID=UPI003D0A3E83